MKLLASSRSQFCRYCAQQTTFRKRQVSHKGHALVSVFTFGLWGAIWLAVILHWLFLAPWRCRVCRRLHRKGGEVQNTPLPILDSKAKPRAILPRRKAR